MKNHALSVVTMGLLVVGFAVPLRGQDSLNRHRVVLDSSGKLLSWVAPQERAYDRVMRLAWDFLLHTVPVESNGLKTYFTYCCMDQDTLHGTAWPHNPAGLYGMFADSGAAYYAYSGDRAVVELVEQLLDYELAHGTTPSDWAWGSVPYASSDHGAREYRGAHSFLYSKSAAVGDGYGVIEPDKVGELGAGYLKFYELTGEGRYRDAALACAEVLARHIRTGDATHSSWPFRVYAEWDVPREEYSSNVIGPVRLFDELVRMNLGDVPAYRRAREMAWAWMMAYPMKNHQWSGYFEDVPLYEKPENFNQYSAMETARYILFHPEYDPDWKAHVADLIAWVEKTFVVDVPKEPGVQWGANAVSEQLGDMNKMGSHTSRYASLNALWYEKTGDVAAKGKAFRSFNWASYMCRENGVVNVGPIDQSIWFSDGYGDYIRHFLAGLGAVPEWAPSDESHLLRSSSIVRSVSYLPEEVNYQTFDEASTEVLRLNFAPRRILADGKELPPCGPEPHNVAGRGQEPSGGGPRPKDVDRPGWVFDEQGGILRLRHENSHTIRILGPNAR